MKIFFYNNNKYVNIFLLNSYLYNQKIPLIFQINFIYYKYYFLN